MKKVWTYLLTVMVLLLSYNYLIVRGNPKETTVYPVIVWWLSGMFVYPVISFIAGLILAFCVKDKKTRFLLILLSGFLFFTVSLLVNYQLLFFRESRVLGWNLTCSIIMALESIGVQGILVALIHIWQEKWKKKKI